MCGSTSLIGATSSLRRSCDMGVADRSPTRTRLDRLRTDAPIEARCSRRLKADLMQIIRTDVFVASIERFDNDVMRFSRLFIRMLACGGREFSCLPCVESDSKERD